MELSDEQIHEIAEPYGALDSEHRRIEFARAIESEVRKQDTELIRQLVDALENHQGNYKLTDAQCVPVNAAVTAGRARMSPPATAEQRVYYTTPGGPTRVIWVTKDYRRV